MHILQFWSHMTIAPFSGLWYLRGTSYWSWTQRGVKTFHSLFVGFHAALWERRTRVRADLDRRPMRICAGGTNRDVAQQTHTVTCTPGRLVQPRTGCVLHSTAQDIQSLDNSRNSYNHVYLYHINCVTELWENMKTCNLCFPGQEKSVFTLVYKTLLNTLSWKWNKRQKCLEKNEK